MDASTNHNPFADAEQALAAAGIGFTVVDRCPTPVCPICANRVTLADAA